MAAVRRRRQRLRCDVFCAVSRETSPDIVSLPGAERLDSDGRQWRDTWVAAVAKSVSFRNLLLMARCIVRNTHRLVVKCV